MFFIRCKFYVNNFFLLININIIWIINGLKIMVNNNNINNYNYE